MTAALRVLVVLVLAVSMAGCFSSGGSPNLLAPKLIVDAGPDDEPLLYVHSAFGERRYDRIEVSVDNATFGVRQNVYSLESPVHAHAFFLQVNVTSGDAVFTFTGTFRLDPGAAEADVIVRDVDGEWSDVRRVELPNERILSRAEVEET